MEGNYWCWQLTHSYTLSLKCFHPLPPKSPLLPPLHCYTVKQRQMSIISVCTPLFLNLSILTFSCLRSIMPAPPTLPLFLSSIPLHHSAVLRRSAHTACRQLADWGRKGKHRLDGRASCLPADTSWHTGNREALNRQMWTETSSIFVLTFSSLPVSPPFSLSVCVPPDCSRTVSLALIPPPPSSFFLLLLWLLLSQTCCCWVSASTPPLSLPHSVPPLTTPPPFCISDTLSVHNISGWRITYGADILYFAPFEKL